VGDYRGPGGLSESRRTVEQRVIERLAALQRRCDRDLQILADAILADVVVQPPRGKAGFVLGVFVHARRGHQSWVGHEDGETKSVRAVSMLNAANPRIVVPFQLRTTARGPCRLSGDGSRD